VTIQRIVLTGGPGGGKTTGADLLRREIGEQLVVVPESASLLFDGGFPRVADGAARVVQRAIYEVQRGLEDVQSICYPDRVLLCDRGTVDSAAYWPDGPEAFFEAMGSCHAAELGRYDAVLFFETAAVGGLAIEGGNRHRVESNEEAVDLDRRLRALWKPHPCFHLVPHQPSFMAKLMGGLTVLRGLLAGETGRR
jgi:predicted ATPase